MTTLTPNALPLWTPHVTVAAVVERNGRFLLVDEETDEGRLRNQPAGHWEPGESLVEAAVRETREETGLELVPRFLIGIYRWHAASRDVTYLRFAFAGDVIGSADARPSDPAVYGVLWQTIDEIRATPETQRGPQVRACVEDYLAGRRWPLDLLVDVG
jgi:8-oxo-dGTP pyrophosphatase MutT (NUDIX family)